MNELLWKRRIERNLSLRELADLLKMSNGYLSLIERNLSRGYSEKAAQKINDFFGEEVVPPPPKKRVPRKVDALDLLWRRRCEHDLSMQALADILGMPLSRYESIENKICPYSVEAAQRINDFFGEEVVPLECAHPRKRRRGGGRRLGVRR